MLYAGSCHATASCRPAMRRGFALLTVTLYPFTHCLRALMTGIGGSRLARSSSPGLLTRARPWTWPLAMGSQGRLRSPWCLFLVLYRKTVSLLLVRWSDGAMERRDIRRAQLRVHGARSRKRSPHRNEAELNLGHAQDDAWRHAHRRTALLYWSIIQLLLADDHQMPEPSPINAGASRRSPF